MRSIHTGLHNMLVLSNHRCTPSSPPVLLLATVGVCLADNIGIKNKCLDSNVPGGKWSPLILLQLSIEALSKHLSGQILHQLDDHPLTNAFVVIHLP